MPKINHAEIWNLYHIAKIALSDSSKHSRLIYAAKEYSKIHPEVSSTWAYKYLTRIDTLKW